VIAPGLGAIWPPTTRCDLSRASNSWCHGAAGIALALHGCYMLSGERAYRDLFTEATAAVIRMRSPSQTFCCGRAGRAQVLIELYRQTGERRWLTAARRVTAEPTRRLLSQEYPAGFHQGALGLTYLAARLKAPDRLGLPATGCARLTATR
jgi:serine/threonine-protein kinase